MLDVYYGLHCNTSSELRRGGLEPTTSSYWSVLRRPWPVPSADPGGTTASHARARRAAVSQGRRRPTVDLIDAESVPLLEWGPPATPSIASADWAVCSLVFARGSTSTSRDIVAPRGRSSSVWVPRTACEPTMMTSDCWMI